MALREDESGEGGAPSPRLQAVAAMMSRIGAAIGVVLIAVVLIGTAVSVFSRYVLARPLLGVDEGTGFLVVAIVMFGAAEALRRDDHIRIDLLLHAAGPRLRRLLELWSHAGVLAFAVLLLATAWHTVTFSRGFGAYSDGYLALPLWIPQSALLVGAALLGLQALAGLIRQIGRR